ncbi:hypothetical protein CPB86DRAFT_803597 [Serendipita vermifera]|nr:hypothetical protein CPB86DRAFT_803597 [Serendipita vermifera]
MLWTSLLATVVASLTVSVNAQGAAWSQCGTTGATTCVSGYYCNYLNYWYSQCVPGTASSSSSSSSSSSTSKTSLTIVTDHTTSSTTRTSTTSTSTAPTTTVTGGQSTNPSDGKQIRTVVPPVYHLYLQLINGKPLLGPEATSGYFVYGTTVALVMADKSKLYLNVDTSVSTSYKPLSFSTTATTTNWNMSGDTFRVGNTQNFVVCSISGSSNYELWLQTGSDMPSGRSCTNYVTIHLPCLC